MAALTHHRNTAIKSRGRTIRVPVAGGVRIWNGSQVAANAAGFLVPAEDAPGLTVLGRAEEAADNRFGADGALSIHVAKGVFKWATDPTSPVTQARAGRPVFALDDQTVVAASVNAVVAGILDEIDPDGEVWVATL
jgi:hypothetical protein